MLSIKNNLASYIRKYRGNQSLREFAKKCGISHTHLDSIEKGIDPRSGKSVRVTIDTLEKIAKAMNMTINDLLINSGEVSNESINEVNKNKYIHNYVPDDDDLKILELLKEMDNEKKKTIINFIKTFR